MTIRIGQEHYGYVYELKQTVLGGVWVCRRGSDWSQADEKLILVREDEYPRSTTAAIIYSIRTGCSVASKYAASRSPHGAEPIQHANARQVPL